MAFSKRLNLILLFSILVLILSIIRVKIPSKSKYNKDKYLYGTILDITKNPDKTTFILKGKENVLVNYYDGYLNIKVGDYVKIVGELKKPNANNVFNLFNYKNYLKSKKINYIFVLDKVKFIKNGNILYRIKNLFYKRIEKFNNEYLTTFILGKNTIEEGKYEIYQNNGISHLFAISGMHISLLTAILSFILKKLIKKEFLIYILISLFLLFYMFITNFSPSVIRSSLLFIGIGLNKVLKLDYKTIEVLLIIFSVLLIYNAYYIYSISFIFSFTISFYLILFNKKINQYSNYFIKIFLISLISFLVSIPIVINSFFTINILTPIINVISVPFISLIIFPFALLTFLFPFLNVFLVFIVDKFEVMSVFLSRFSINLIFGHMNLISIIIYYLIVTSLLIKTNHLKFILFLTFMVVNYACNCLNPYPKLTFIDVGQGDSILLQLPFNKGNILIDTGGNYKYDLSKNVLIPYLKSNGIKRLDYLILTHGDYDHMGSSISLVNNFKIKRVVLNSYENNQLENELINLLNDKNINYSKYNKKILNINGYKLYFLNKQNYDENKDSLIVYTKIKDVNILLMGDADMNNEKFIINEYKLPKIDILKVGHHGSNTSSSVDFLNEIKPNFSIISVASNNIYNHPNQKVIENLKNVGSNVLLTSINGSIKFVLNNELEIYTCY